ncbi:MAG: UMP kinase [Spirochaetales bacterium]|nr:UMP kinase [Spirochaetales bacterium]
MASIQVISLGGSIISPQAVDIHFLKGFYSIIEDYLRSDMEHKLIIVCGGGAPARSYQKAYKQVASSPDNLALDWIGIAATRLNAELIRYIFQDFCDDEVVTDPTRPTVIGRQILVASGWKPGFSTDYDAVLLAERFHAEFVINLSNIEQVYTDDPKQNPEAAPIKDITWVKFKELVGEKWEPGRNVPFDPVATAHAARIGLKVIFALGRDGDNLKSILNAKPYIGTLIHP